VGPAEDLPALVAGRGGLDLGAQGTGAGRRGDGEAQQEQVAAVGLGDLGQGGLEGFGLVQQALGEGEAAVLSGRRVAGGLAVRHGPRRATTCQQEQRQDLPHPRFRARGGQLAG